MYFREGSEYNLSVVYLFRFPDVPVYCISLDSNINISLLLINVEIKVFF